MTRLRRLGSRLLRVVVSADALGLAGVACVAAGAWMAWPPAGFLVLGAALLWASRTEATR